MSNLGDVLQLVAQLTEDEVSKQILSLVDKAAEVYVPPLCEVIAKSTMVMYTSLMDQGFDADQAIRLLVAMVGKTSGGSK